MIISRIDANGFHMASYRQSYIDDNFNKIIDGILVSDWLLTDVVYDLDFLKPKLVEGVWVEGAISTQLQIESIRVGKEAIKTAYSFHRENGFKYAEEFEDFLAEEVLIYKNITEDQALDIGHFFKMVLFIITRGQWKSAEKELNEVLVTESYMQPYFTKLNTYVEEYISTKYTQ